LWRLANGVAMAEVKMSDVGKRVVIMGVGDPMRQDEGVGVHVVRALAAGPCADQAELVDGGEGVFEALSHKRAIEKLVVLNALRAGRPPGSIARVSLRDLADRPGPALSQHEQGLLDTLAFLGQAGLRVGEIVIYWVEPGKTGWGTDLSEQVEACLPLLAAQVERELGLTPPDELRV
jgi:hydrogenase maturation protease